MVKIKFIKAREILDSRGNPTIETDVLLENGFIAREQVPSGASTGRNEALELRDNKKRYDGKGVLKAVDNVNKIIAKKLKNYNLKNEKDIMNIDALMIILDNTDNKKNLGANAILSVSLAVSKAISMINHEPLYKTLNKLSKEIAKENKYKIIPKLRLPRLFMNIINGGQHAQNGLSFQEFMIVPEDKSLKERVRIGAEVYHELKKLLKDKYGKTAVNVGDEGGFAPVVDSYEEPLELIMKAIENLNYNKKVKIALDVAASSFYDSKINKYLVNNNGIKQLDKNQMIALYERLIDKYPIISIEDPLHEEDFDGFAKLKKKIVGKKELMQIVGDDLLVTNTERIKTAIEHNSCNALLLKVNQIGTVSEAINSALLAMNNNWNVMVSHRSGETESTFISHLAVALGCGQIKTGAPCRGERTAKYNELMRIEEEL